MKKMKKGFTIVELVIVIAVIAILAAVLIPVFSNVVDKANKSKDTQLVRNLNSALASDLGEHNTMYDALQAAKEYGYDVGKINASATDNEILWDSKNDCFVYLDDGEFKYIPNSKTYDNVADHEYWIISDTVNETYSTYYTGDEDIESPTTTSICIATDNSNLVINAPNAKDIIHYNEEGGSVIIEEVYTESYHLFGRLDYLQVGKGHVVIEGNSEVKALHVAGNGANIDIDSQATVSKTTKDADVDDAQITVKVAGTTVDIAEIATTNDVGAKLFASGLGTSEKPYIIETAEQLQNIGENYENYAYYQVAYGVESLDCSDINLINLHGSFDGNNVKLININNVVLFENIGYNANNETIVVKNFVANIAGAPALAKNVVNAGTTTFENIKITGYIEGASNLGSFYRFGTGQAGGANYTVKFVNCKSTANIFTTEGSVGGFVGHAFPGAGYQAYLDVDDNCEYTGTVYSAQANEGDEFFGIGGGVITKNGEAYADNEANRATLNVVNIELTAEGYTTTIFNNVQSIAINIAPQLTAYKDDGEIDPNNAGITGLINLAVMENVSSGETVTVLESITELRIVNGANENGYTVNIEDGVLTVYTNRSANFQTGAVRLEVVQYDANGNILAIGRIELGQITK